MNRRVRTCQAVTPANQSVTAAGYGLPETVTAASGGDGIIERVARLASRGTLASTGACGRRALYGRYLRVRVNKRERESECAWERVSVCA